jgi:hypothetical protein
MTLVSTDIAAGLAVTLALALTRTGPGRPEMFPDAEILERRASAFERLPWPIPATVVLQMSDAELDALADATPKEYWAVLNRIVGRITGGDDG